MNALPEAEGEVLREGRRVLRKLAAANAYLAPTEKGDFALLADGKGAAKLRLSAAMVEAFRRRGWLDSDTRHASAFRLSDAGLGWIRRALATEAPFAAQHQLRAVKEVASPEGTLQELCVNEGEAPLGWLRHRRGSDGQSLITAVQFEAGEKLRNDFTVAQMTPRMAVDLAAPVVAGRRGAKSDTLLPETVLAAKQRVRRALAAVGPGLADLLLDICCHLRGLEAAERQNGWPRRSAKIVLQIALDRLALHYGLVGKARRTSPIRSWRDPDSEQAAP